MSFSNAGNLGFFHYAEKSSKHDLLKPSKTISKETKKKTKKVTIKKEKKVSIKPGVNKKRSSPKIPKDVYNSTGTKSFKQLLAQIPKFKEIPQIKFNANYFLSNNQYHGQCLHCIIDAHDLSRSALKEMYTDAKYFQKLNHALNCGRFSDPVNIFTRLLSEAIYEQMDKNVPSTVYRGITLHGEARNSFLTTFENNIGTTFYSWGFFSTSESFAVAKSFGNVIMQIETIRGRRNCFADMSHHSKFDEKEWLISANAGFRIDKVIRGKGESTSTIYLTFIDESFCITTKRSMKCNAHSKM